MGEGDGWIAGEEDQGDGNDAGIDQRVEDEREWKRVEEVSEIDG